MLGLSEHPASEFYQTFFVRSSSCPSLFFESFVLFFVSFVPRS